MPDPRPLDPHERSGGPPASGAAPLLALVGPTAAGKTELAIGLARRLSAEIVSMDSMLVYRGMDVGTAKPGLAERGGVVHHALDLVEPAERFDASRWLSEVRAVEGGPADAGRGAAPPLLFVGGTALYLRVLTHGLFEGPAVDPELRAALERRFAELGPQALHAELVRVDPAAAARLHANDRKRVLRALEVHAQTGTPLSELQGQWERAAARAPRPLRLVGLRPERATLEARILARIEAMLAAGWLDEVRRLEAAGWLGPTAIQALGYREALELAHGRLSTAEFTATVVQRTRQFVRRQRTWFRRYPEIQWAPEALLERPDELLEWALERLAPEPGPRPEAPRGPRA